MCSYPRVCNLVLFILADLGDELMRVYTNNKQFQCPLVWKCSLSKCRQLDNLFFLINFPLYSWTWQTCVFCSLYCTSALDVLVPMSVLVRIYSTSSIFLIPSILAGPMDNNVNYCAHPKRGAKVLTSFAGLFPNLFMTSRINWLHVDVCSSCTAAPLAPGVAASGRDGEVTKVSRKVRWSSRQKWITTGPPLASPWLASILTEAVTSCCWAVEVRS